MSTAPTTRRRLAAAAVGALAAITALVSAPAALASPGQTVLPLGERDPATLANELVGGGSVVSGASVSGSTSSVGSFGGMHELGIASGVALTTGYLTPSSNVVTGPNTHFMLSGNIGTPGDDDLGELAGQSTYDAATLEFDVVPDTDTMTVQFVFGTDEFPARSSNDAFGFFVNGVNYATVVDDSGTERPVSVEAIDPRASSTLATVNWSGDRPGAVDTEFNLFTRTMAVTAPVTPGQTNHVKMAIADAGDREGDSAVLIVGADSPINTAPIASNFAVSTTSNAPVDVSLQATDADGDVLTFSIDTP